MTKAPNQPSSEQTYSPEVGVRTRSFAVGDGKELAVKEPLSSLGDRLFISPRGSAAELPVYAELTLPEADDDRRWVLTQRVSDADSRERTYLMAQVEDAEDGTLTVRDVPELKAYGGGAANFSIPYAGERRGARTTVYLEDGKAGDNFAWRISAGGDPVKITVDEDVETVRKPRNKRETERRLERRHRWYKRIGAVGLAHAVLTSGGVADRVFDQFDDAGSRVHQVSEELMDPLYLPTDMLDGIMMQDYPEGTLEEYNQGIIDRNQSIEAATNRVAQTMEDLDAHRYDAIRERADAYRQSHADQLLSFDQREELLQRLEAAQTNGDAIAILRDFAAFYGLDAKFQTDADTSVASFDTTTDASDTVYTVRAIIDSLGVIPKNTLTDSGLRTIELGSFQLTGLGGALGVYRPDEGVLSIAVRSETGRGMQKAEDAWQSIDTSQSATVAHEWTHADQSFGYEGNGGVNATKLALGMVEHALRSRIVNNTESITPYASTGEKEFEAENVSGVISERTDGLAHPDVARYYHSNANRAMLKELIELDAADQYFADYIVAENGRLMDRGVWAVAR